MRSHEIWLKHVFKGNLVRQRRKSSNLISLSPPPPLHPHGCIVSPSFSIVTASSLDISIFLRRRCFFIRLPPSSSIAAFDHLPSSYILFVGYARWQLPSEGYFKLNMDVALDVDRNLVGVGVVVRHALGAITQRLDTGYTPQVVKVVAVCD
ncbi:hypothetical protein LWI29_037882 [Acer saccharum]|uniref:Uncharacterized protein n=1 Tax=Acer saccharum TaxID=4024 RepID=A0AA39W9U0_ACESA|nr:hypothetical protein LWI29_037882 [Acer saccharum]